MITEVTKILVKDDGTLYTEYMKTMEYGKSVQQPVSRKELGTGRIHEDLAHAFDALTGHLAIRCNLKEELIIDRKAFQLERVAILGMRVTGLEFKGYGNEKRVRLIGEQNLPEAGVLELKAPPIFLERDEYEFAEILKEDVDKVVEEALLYITEGKQMHKQIALDDDLDHQIEEAAEVKEKPKAKRRVKKADDNINLDQAQA